MRAQMIMVPVDGSEPSLKSAEAAVWLAELTGGQILLVHCHRPYPQFLGEPYFQQLVTKTINRANELLEPYRILFESKKIAFTERILEGPAGRMIPEAAKHEACDLIIMGSRGRSDLEGLLLGSVTHKVLHSAHCPVLVIR